MGWEYRRYDGAWVPFKLDTMILADCPFIRLIPDDPQPWTTLAELRPGAIFEMQDGRRLAKIHQRHDIKLVAVLCLWNGDVDALNPATAVREIVLPEG